jgi:hypothetical protein
MRDKIVIIEKGAYKTENKIQSDGRIKIFTL